MTGEAHEDGGGRTSLLAHRAVWAALLVIAVILAFGSAINGALVWDDATMVGNAAVLRSPWEAFSRDFFGLGARAAQGAGASYFRPLVSLSFALDVRVFSAAPHFGLHLVNLLWHALASVLVAGALTRWTRATTLQGRLACWLAALFWAVLPAKAENVAWISGRADVMGLGLLLLGLALRAEEAKGAGRAVVRVAAAGGATALALLCKESFVIAPVIVAVDVLGDRDDDADIRARVRRVLRAPETIASVGLVLAYLVFRRAYLPIQGGGEAMFAGLSLGDRVGLVIETLGHAAQAIVLCFEARLLRGPIGFEAPFVLQHDGGMAIFGAAFVVALAVTAWRAPRLRPAVILLAGALLPVANVIPSGLESRFSDRFLYVPSLGVALAMAVLLATAAAPAFRAVALGILTGAVGLSILTMDRSMDFRSSRSLWERERKRSRPAPSVLHNAAMAALRDGQLEQARDRLLETATRYEELGFDEGYPYRVAAVEAHVRATGESSMDALLAYRALLEGLASGASTTVKVPLPNGKPLRLPTGTPAARQYAAGHAREIRVRLAVLDARSGEEKAAAVARAEVDACPRCGAVLREAARVELALAHPDRAAELLARLGPDEEAERDALALTAQLQVEVLRGGDRLAKARAMFLGEAYRPACLQGEEALAEKRNAPEAARATIALACRLTGFFVPWQKLSAGLDPELAKDMEDFGWAYRTSPERRFKLFGVRPAP